MATIHPVPVEEYRNGMSTPPVAILDGENQSFDDQSQSQPAKATGTTGSWQFRLYISLFILVYTSWGAWVFQQLEHKPELDRLYFNQKTLSAGRLKLLDAIVQLKDNSEIEKGESNSTEWSVSVNAIVAEYEAVIDSILDDGLKIYLNESQPLTTKWQSYSQVFFFVTSLTTTIGYGNIAPRTTWGRIFCIAYSLIGIPVMLIFISQAGKIFANFSIGVYTRLVAKRLKWSYFSPQNRSRKRKMLGTSLSMSGAVTFLMCYTGIGAVLFSVTESWGFINSFYFCYITMTTIGFGDLIPVQGYGSVSLIMLRSVYTVFGLAITSTSIELVRKHYSDTWSKEIEEMESAWKMSKRARQGLAKLRDDATFSSRKEGMAGDSVSVKSN